MKRWKQILSLLLCLCMLVSYFPELAVHSHAEEEETEPTIEVETEITEPEEPEEPEESISEEPEEVVPEENEEPSEPLTVEASIMADDTLWSKLRRSDYPKGRPNAKTLKGAYEELYDLFFDFTSLKLGTVDHNYAYATTDGKSCGNDSCSKCQIHNIATEMEKAGLITAAFKSYVLKNGSSYSCQAFADFARYFIYGQGFGGQSDIVATLSGTMTGARIETFFTENLQFGDMISSSPNHKWFFISFETDGIRVLDNNNITTGYGGSGQHNTVQFLTLPYSFFTGKDEYKVVRPPESLLEQYIVSEPWYNDPLATWEEYKPYCRKITPINGTISRKAIANVDVYTLPWSDEDPKTHERRVPYKSVPIEEWSVVAEVVNHLGGEHVWYQVAYPAYYSGRTYQFVYADNVTFTSNSTVTFTNTGHSLETTNSARVSATWQNPDRITLTHGGVIYGKSSLVNMTPTYAQLTADTWSNSNCLRFIENVKKGYENSASERMYYDLNNLSPGTEYHARVFMIDEFKKVHMQSGETVFSTTSRCTTHTWDSGKVTKAASCKETGVKTYTCTVCGGTKTETIDKTTNHSWGSWTKVDGTNHKRTCSVCSASESAVHNYSYVEDPKPTFTTTGTITGTCGACRNVITDTFPVISEKDYVRSIFKEPTYTEQGEERWTWKNTAYGDRHFHFPIPKLVPVSKITLNYTEKTLCKDQEFTLSATVTPSDAANTGVHWKTSNANVATRNYNTQLVHANGVGTAVFTAEADDYQGAVATCTVRVVDHAYTYAVTTAPTTSAPGTLTGTCSGCNGTTTVALPKLDTTNYTYSVVKAPSATAEGTGRYTWKTTTYGTFYFDVVLEKTGITGTCGTNLTWTLTNTGVLTISGTGEMENYVTITLLGGKRAPWYDYRTDIASVVIENGVTSIGNYAFNGCSSLSGVTIAASVTGIGGNAFAGCTALRSIEIPANVSSIAATAFANCSALTTIQVNANNKTYTSVDGILFTKDKTTLVRYPLGKTGAYRIPDSVTAVGNYAFSGCTGLTDITIPNSVVSIGSNAFSGCSALNHVYFDGIQKEWDAIEKDSAGLPENIEVEFIHVHNFTYVVAKEPGTALFATGRLTGTCSGCSEEKTVVLPRLTATDYNYSVIKETTCLVDGTGRYTWKNTTYGTFYFDVTIPTPGHSYSYKATTAPITSAVGTLTGTCAKCGDTTTVTLPKLDTTNYTYSEIQAATETATGIGRYTWKNTDYGTFTFDVVIPKLEPQIQRGDLNGDGKVTDLDVSALLRHILFPARYEIIGDADFNKDGKLTDADAGYLLKHTLFPTRYPL